VPQLVVIVEILIPKRDRKHPLAHQRHNLVLDQFGAASIVKAVRKAPDQINGAIGRPQKQGPCVRCDETRVKSGDYLSPFDYSKIKLFCATLWLHRGVSRIGKKSLVAQLLLLIRSPDALNTLRNAG
jgi:hypothetical protein